MRAVVGSGWLAWQLPLLSSRLRVARGLVAPGRNRAAEHLPAGEISGRRLESDDRAGAGRQLRRRRRHEAARLVRAACPAEGSRAVAARQRGQRDAAGRYAADAQPAAQLAVLALDYRGYGRSEGKPTEAGVLLDARAGRKWLAEKEGIAESDVVLMGFSLGGGVAVDLAASDGARGLVLASTFTSLPDVAQHHMSWLPMSWLMTMRMNSLEKIKEYRGPLLCVARRCGRSDSLRAGAGALSGGHEPKRLITVSGGKHNDPQPEEYRVALDQFIAELPPLGSAAVQAASVDVSVSALGP